MATIIVEDGTIVSGANSYVSEAELTTYATDRGLTLTADEDELLIKAMDYLESQNFIGVKYTKDQPLQWPRVGAIIDGYYVDADEIPQLLKNVLMEIAVNIDADRDPLAPIEQKIKRKKVDVLEIEYSDNSAGRTITPKISVMLKKLVSGGSTGGNVVRVNKG